MITLARRALALAGAFLVMALVTLAMVLAVSWIASLAQAQGPSQKEARFYLGKLSATGTTPAFDLPATLHKHTLQAVITGSPAACAFQLEGTLDKSDDANAVWANLSGTQPCTTSPAMFHVIERPVSAIRANVTSLSAAATVAIKYVGME